MSRASVPVALLMAVVVALVAAPAVAQTEPAAQAPLVLPAERPAIPDTPATEAPAAQVPAAETPVAAGEAPADAPVTLPPERPAEPDLAPPTVLAPDDPALATPGFSAPSGAVVPASTQPELVGHINAYLNSIRIMSGTFTQLGPDGTRTTGKFYISKPGRLRFQYDPPSQVELIADGRSVAVRDRKLNTQDLYLIGQTPLRFLLQDTIDLLQDPNVVGVSVDPDLVSVTLQEEQAIGGAAQIVLMFSATDYSLKQWSITDAQGFQTAVAIFDINTVDTPPDRLFYIDETRMAN
ncbi:MAG: outer-membrane lipoprotein carrier protein LolA [Labrys sp. (in: a-proteobacteria)]|jgi:outer membrane lipoprotein-sorting protein